VAIMPKIPLTEYEIELVRYCAQHYLDKGEILGYAEFPRYEELGRRKILEAEARFVRFGLMRGWASNGVEILPAVFDLLEQWDNPPLPDYRDRLTKWVWSKPRRIIIYLLVVVCPAFVGGMVIKGAVSGWLGIK